MALLFPWVKLARQVAVTGVAEKVSLAESARYFASRPHESQLGAWISQQSAVLSSRQLLMNELEKIKARPDALLLQTVGREAQARALFQEILRGAKAGSRHSQQLNRVWIETARKALG